MSNVVLCPNCRIQFSPGLGRRPICNKYEPPSEAKLAYFEDKAVEALETGARDAGIRQSFENAGLTGYEADVAMQSAKRTSRATNRKTGLSRIIGGLAIALAGALLGLMFLPIFGAALCIAGIVQLLTGRYMD